MAAAKKRAAASEGQLQLTIAKLTGVAMFASFLLQPPIDCVEARKERGEKNPAAAARVTVRAQNRMLEWAHGGQ